MTILFLMVYELSIAQGDSLYFQKIKDASGNEQLLGACSRMALQLKPFSTWVQSNYDSFVVDSATCRFVEPLLNDKMIAIFMDTWCGDSRREVPQVLKMLACCNFPARQVQLILVSNQDSMYKQSPHHEKSGRNIVRVPTVIIEEAGKEKRRKVEYPVVSLEKDILRILLNEKYIPNYPDLRVRTR